MNNKYFPKWLGPVFVGLYIATTTKHVLEGKLSVGSFLATINILRGIAGQFSDLYKILMELNVLVGPLRSLVHLLNMPTEVPIHKKTFDERREMTRRARASMNHGSIGGVVEDAIPLKIVNMRMTFKSDVT
eukprot:CAMPEP_0115597992 /NCGR_PEP_ID=MMETSP0272-20121206/13644_1 /TAXON_ID=71861 /ORGANISM="Scrippsiella trochoidea, Strain CCMP3099" /LENGTH=130 /DNA_ID=CAMNT_0003033393 /DNA_START=517 /DNA_END=905 /DNA_ORIENTATION=+